MTTPRHQVSLVVARVHTELDAVTDASMWSMDPSETAMTLIEITRTEARLAGLKHRIAAHADDVHVGEETGATSAAAWLAGSTRQTHAAAHRAVAFGHTLDAHPATRAALAAGDLVLEQAQVIIRAVDDLPDDLDPGLVTRAEEYLLGQAGHHNAKTLRILGRKLLEVIAPEIADQHEADLLAKEEEKAAMACRLTMTDDGHGKTHGRFTLPTL